MDNFIELNTCLACGCTDLENFVSLGSQPLANDFHDGTTELKTFPISVNVCRSCWHSQQSIAVDPNLIFSQYPYVSGTSTTLRAYMRDFAERVAPEGKSTILEIGCNDGTLLTEFKNLGNVCVGVDPATNLPRPNGIRVYGGYWSEEAIKPLHGLKFDTIVAMNVLAHVADPLTFLQLCKRVLAPGGRIFIQVSQAKMIERGEFDTLYLEHVSFFTVSSMLALAYRARLRVDVISHVPVHGTSYLFELVDSYGIAPTWDDFPIGRVEHDKGYYAISIYERFAHRADEIRRDAKNLISSSREQGYRIVGYGAAAKAMTFINFCGLQLDCIIDDNPLKVGKLTPGMNIPVVEPPMVLISLHKILFVILAWNFRDEIMGRIKSVRGDLIGRDSEDDKFLTFFPTVSLI